jgi:uncharacterized membrane protein
MQKERKIYKTKSDKHSDYFDHKNQFSNVTKTVRNISILPHPTTLESYEEISPGITEKLSSMILKEQEHRHKLAIRKIQNITRIHRFGQILSATLAILIIYATFLMFIEYNNVYLASVICISGFAFLTIINLSAAKNFKKDKEGFQHRYFKKKPYNPS